MSIERNGRKYGDFRLIGNSGDAFFAQSIEDQARDQGWSEACPVVERLIKPEANGGRGAENMRNRYGEINFWMGYIFQLLEKGDRPDLAASLILPQKRKPDEPVGVHDRGWTPPELANFTYRSPEAYGLPRMFVEYVKFFPEEADTRLVTALNYLDEAIAYSSNITQVAVAFAEKVVIEIAAESKKEAALLFRHLISNGKLKEDNSESAYRNVFWTIRHNAPALWKFYLSLSPGEKIEYRIIDEQAIV